MKKSMKMMKSKGGKKPTSTTKMTPAMKMDGFKRGGSVKGMKVGGKAGKARLDKVTRGGSSAGGGMSPSSPKSSAGRVTRAPGTGPASTNKEND